MPDLDFSRISRRFWNRLFRETDADQQPGPRLSRNIQLVEIVADDSHLLRPIFNPGAIASVTLAAGGAGIFTGVEITAPAASSVVVHELTNRAGAENIVVTYLEPAGKVIVAPWQRLTVPGGATNTDFLSVMDSITVTSNGAAGDFFVLLAGLTLDQLPLLLTPGQSLFFIGNLANTAFEMTLALTQVG